MSADATSQQVPGTEPSAGSANGWTLVVASVAAFMLMLDVTVVNVALPDLQQSFDATLSDLLWVIDAYTLALAAFLLAAGSLADRLGRRLVFCVGLVIFTLSSLVAGAAQDMLMLNLARGVQGLGAAVLFAVGPALIGQEFQGKARGQAFGIFGGVTGLALAIGPALGGVLAEGSWRWIFLVNVPIGLGLLVLGLIRLRESKDPSQHKVDWAGVLLLSLALVLIVLGFLRGESQGWASAQIVAAFVVGVVLLVAFFAVEQRKGEAAMLHLNLFRNRTFVGLSTATFLSNATSLAVIFLEVSYLQNVLGDSALGAGLKLLPLTLILFVVAAITGGLVGKVAPNLLMGLSIAFIAIGMGLIALIGPGSSWLMLLPSMVVMGVGMGMFNPPRSTLAIGVVEPRRAGMAAGVGETFQQVGVAVGVAGFGALFQHAVVSRFVEAGVGTDEVGRVIAAGGGDDLAASAGPAFAATARDAFVHGFTQVAVICAVVCGVGAVIAFVTIRRKDLHDSALGEEAG